ncbi:hypothetical protein HYU07_00580 [Candidatus Woesearchaeota archaeon]|nr:hypothetical protein [Candidatus Woesearchaeota archaeon]
MAKKAKTVDDIIANIQGVVNKPFKERIKKFEEFHAPEKQYDLLFAQHAEYVVMGKPSDRKSFPGAYEEAYKKLDTMLEEDSSKLKKEGDIRAILEVYVDKFLERAMGEKFKDTLEQAKKEGLSEEDIRDMKGSLFSQYHPTREGIVNPLSKEFIKQFVGKTKLEAIEALKGLAENSKKLYASYLNDSATEGLIKQYDVLDLTKHLKPKFKEAGFKPREHYLKKRAHELEAHYEALIKGAGEQLQKYGYEKITKKENAKDGNAH